MEFYHYLGFRLIDYEGGDNPMLIYLFVACVCLALAATLWAYLRRLQLKSAFYRQCKKKKVPNEVLHVFVHFMRIKKIPISPEILVNRVLFDKFMNHIGFHFLSNESSGKLNPQELQLLGELREELFPSIENSKFSSSRYFSVNQALEISFYDRLTQSFVSFPTHVVDNKHYGLVVQAPQISAATALPAHEALNVSFEHPEKGYKLSFESYLMQKNEEQEIWKIYHSYFIEKEEIKEVQIPAKLLYKQEDKRCEAQVIIQSLSPTSCRIMGPKLAVGESGLLQFMALGEELNFSVKSQKELEQGCQMAFIALDEHLKASLRKVLR